MIKNTSKINKTNKTNKKQMLRKIIIGTTTLILFSLTAGCEKKQEITYAGCDSLALSMLDNDETENMAMIELDEKNSEDIFNRNYDCKLEVISGCIIVSIDQYATEVVVAQVETKEEAEKLKEAFENKIDKKTASYTGYFPEEVEKLNNSYAYIYKDKYVILDISEKVDEDKKNIEEQFSFSKEDIDEFLADRQEKIKKLKETGEMIEDNQGENTAINDSDTSTEEEITDESQLKDIDDSVYFNQDIVKAYKNKTPNILKDKKDKEIYKKVTEIIEKIITSHMTPLEKEKAVHDYICENMNYDDQELAEEGNMREDSDNPYGMLVNGYGICSGYSSTFKLFMDCLEIPCIIVEGKAYDFESDHAWNQVILDGKYYNVDVTWDDPVMPTDDEESKKWINNYYFFNCSDDVLQENSHEWNKTLYNECPESMDTSSFY